MRLGTDHVSQLQVSCHQEAHSLKGFALKSVVPNGCGSRALLVHYTAAQEDINDLSFLCIDTFVCTYLLSKLTKKHW